VYGVQIPATEGRAGMATLVTEEELDLVRFRRYLKNRLPGYARPLFLRIRKNVELTGTLKYSKTELVREGFDPVVSTDALYFDNAESGAFIPLDRALYERIQTGDIRL
jgi:fatty-acyl-CoA synthase